MSFNEQENLTPDRLQMIEEYAGYFFTPEEIGVIMGMRTQWVRFQMLAENPTDFKNAYTRGQLMAEAEIRKSIFELAKSGSGPAQVLATQFMEKFQLRKIDV